MSQYHSSDGHRPEKKKTETQQFDRFRDFKCLLQDKIGVYRDRVLQKYPQFMSEVFDKDIASELEPYFRQLKLLFAKEPKCKWSGPDASPVIELVLDVTCPLIRGLCIDNDAHKRKSDRDFVKSLLRLAQRYAHHYYEIEEDCLSGDSQSHALPPYKVADKDSDIASFRLNAEFSGERFVDRIYGSMQGPLREMFNDRFMRDFYATISKHEEVLVYERERNASKKDELRYDVMATAMRSLLPVALATQSHKVNEKALEYMFQFVEGLGETLLDFKKELSQIYENVIKKSIAEGRAAELLVQEDNIYDLADLICDMAQYESGINCASALYIRNDLSESLKEGTTQNRFLDYELKGFLKHSEEPDIFTRKLAEKLGNLSAFETRYPIEVGIHNVSEESRKIKAIFAKRLFFVTPLYYGDLRLGFHLLVTDKDEHREAIQMRNLKAVTQDSSDSIVRFVRMTQRSPEF